MKQYLLFIILMCLHVGITCKAQTFVSSDSCLQRLINEATVNNSDVRSAELNITQAETMLRSARLAYLPSFTFAPSYSLSKAQKMPLEKSYALPIIMDWELNLGGRQKFEKQSAKAKCEEAKHLLNYTKIQLIASLSNAYFTLVMLDRQIVITEESVKNQEESLSTLRAFKEVGKANDLAINEVEATVLATKASLLELDNQRKQTELAILLMINRQSGTITRSRWENIFPCSINDSTIPLNQLSSRPDVKAAEMELTEACGNVGVANSAFYPTLSITAEAGWTNNIGEIVNPAKILLKLIGSLTQPIFNRGVNKAQKEIAIAQRQQAEIAFEKALLTAGNEVEEALYEIKIMKEKLPLRKKQVEVSKQAFENCKLLMDYSQTVTYLDVLTAQNSYLNAQLQETADWLLMQQAYINLYKATCPQP